MTRNAAEGQLEVRNVSHVFGGTQALDDVSLNVGAGEFFALLGPSGCGKTTLLRVMAGFVTPTSGEIVVDGQDMTGLAPYRRPLNMMFQSYALFPHLSVAGNVAYGLKAAKLPRREVGERVGEVLAAVHLSGMEKRRPHELSGGQRQRVALARALAVRPRLLLLDEPLSALDRQIRLRMQDELKDLQHRLGMTFVIVTHDQEEALALGDRIAVMSGGKVAQIGRPQELYASPRTEFVAGFLGEATVLKGQIVGAGDGRRMVAGQQTFGLGFELNGVEPGAAVGLVLRPEELRIDEAASAPDAGGCNELSGQLLSSTFLGSTCRHVVRLPDGASVQVRTSPQATPALRPGQEVVVRWPYQAGALVHDESEPART